jgi:hypothetical protein
MIFQRYAELGSVALLKAELERAGIVSKRRVGAGGELSGGKRFSRGALYLMLQSWLRQSERAAYESGVSGVPTVSVNGKLAFSGALKAEAMIAKIRAAAGAMPIAHGSSPAGTAPVRQAR